MVYSAQYITSPNTSVMSSTNLYTNIYDNWSFIYYPSNDNSIVYSELITEQVGNSKASILLIQETN
jgi:hypothetical protein